MPTFLSLGKFKLPSFVKHSYFRYQEKTSYRLFSSKNKPQPVQIGERSTLVGNISRVIFTSTSNAHSILSVKCNKGKPYTVVGTFPEPKVGETIEAEGFWEIHKNYGQQFRAVKLRTIANNLYGAKGEGHADLSSIEQSLVAFVDGIGPGIAKRIIAAFGEDTFEIIEKNPESLKSIKGIGNQTLQKIKTSFNKRILSRKVVEYCTSKGLAGGMAMKIWNYFGDSAISKLETNPYVLTWPPFSLTFKHVDLLAKKIAAKDPKTTSGEPSHGSSTSDADEKIQLARTKAGILHVLRTANQENGHCGYPRHRLVAESAVFLNKSPEDVSIVVDSLLKEKLLAREALETPIQSSSELIYNTLLYQAENQLADHVLRILQSTHHHPLKEFIQNEDHARRLIKEIAQKDGGQELAPEQEEAVLQALQQKVLVITGGPGVGKTRTIRVIVEIFRLFSFECALAAPTGRAASRLEQMVDYPAATIHRLLGVDHSGELYENAMIAPLPAKLIVVDEVSMLDLPLARALFQSVTSDSVIILVGDVDQLPSVGPGRVLQDLIESGVVKTVYLKEIFRQKSDSGIISAAHMINEGIVPHLTNSLFDNLPANGPLQKISKHAMNYIKSMETDGLPPLSMVNKLAEFQFIETKNEQEAVEMVLKLISTVLPSITGHDSSEIQVLTPMRRGDLGSRYLNKKLQNQLNPPSPEKCQISHFGHVYREGDKVMQIINDHTKQVYNGMTGMINRILLPPSRSEPKNPRDRFVSFEVSSPTLFVNYDPVMFVEYSGDSCADIVPAYAITIHKSQGSEFPVVIIPLHLSHSRMLQRNLLYTAVTRGRELVIIVGSKSAVEKSVSTIAGNERFTMVAKRLKTRLAQSKQKETDFSM